MLKEDEMNILNNCTQDAKAEESTDETFNHIDLGILIFITPCILIGNASVLASMIKFPKLRTRMNLLIANLAVGDLLVGFPTAPLYASMYISEGLSRNKWVCLIKLSAVIASFSCTLITLALLSVERFLAIFHPLHYNTWITKRRVKIAIALIWLYILPVSCMPLLGLYQWNDHNPHCEYFDLLPKPFTITVFVITTGISFPVSTILFTIITTRIRKIQKQTKRMKALQQRCTESHSNTERKNGVMMAFIFLVFVVFWLPFALIIPFRYILADKDLVENIKNLTAVIAMVNSIVNPIVYCWCKPELRTALCSFLSVCCNNSRNKTDCQVN